MAISKSEELIFTSMKDAENNGFARWCI